MPHFKKFDNAVRSVFFKLLYPERVVITDRYERSYQRATLSVGKGGLGLLKTSVSAAALWWSNLRSLQADATIFPFLVGLNTFVPEAIICVSENVGGMESQAWCDLAPSFVVEVYDNAPEPPPKSLLRDLLIALGNFQLLSVKD